MNACMAFNQNINIGAVIKINFYLLLKNLDETFDMATCTEQVDEPKFEESTKSFGLLTDLEASALGTSLINIYEPPLTKIRQQLSEASSKQQLLIEQMQCENERIELSQKEYNLQETFTKMKVYHAKLVNIKKDMTMLHEKSTKLKKRAMRLQEHCQKQALQKELDKERQLQRELKLVEDTTK